MTGTKKRRKKLHSAHLSNKQEALKLTQVKSACEYGPCMHRGDSQAGFNQSQQELEI